MAAQIPVKAIYSGSDVTSLGEYASGDTIADSYIAGLTASKLTGALPAISGAALTNLPADATKLSLAGGTMTGHTLHGDNVFSKWGASDDLVIGHDGSNSYIDDAGNGGLIMRADNFIKLRSKTGNEDMIVATKDAAVEIYHNNVKKLETTAAGATVSGDLTLTNVTETETTKTASFTPNLSTDGTIFDVSGAITITMPSATAGKSFTIIDAGSGTLSWGGTIKWAGGSAPSPSGITIYSFISNGTNWYGMMAGTGFA